MTQFGMPMGVFRLNDLVGLDVSYFINITYAKVWPKRLYNSQLTQFMVEANRLGTPSPLIAMFLASGNSLIIVQPFPGQAKRLVGDGMPIRMAKRLRTPVESSRSYSSLARVLS